MSRLPEFRIDVVWDGDRSGRTPELAATAADVRIRVGDDVLTLLVDTASAQAREHVHAPAYPLAEWMAFHWWSVLADARPGTQISQLRFAYRAGVGDQRGSWWRRSRRHLFRSACDGFRWPDVIVVTEGRETRIVWMPDTGPDVRTGARFVARGNPTVDTEQFVAELRGFVDATVARLDGAGISGTPLQQEWAAVRATDEDEAAFCVAAARLGLDPYTESAPYAERIHAAGHALSGEALTDFLNGVAPDRLADQIAWVSAAARRMGKGPESDAVAELRESCRDISTRFFTEGTAHNPWHIGYAVADRVREWAGLAATEPFDPGPLMRYATAQVPYMDRGLVALGTRTGEDGPALVSTRRFTARPRRFLQARALWRMICDLDDTFVVAAAHTHRQHAERGFALEVLAPARGIATLLADPAHLVSAEDVELIADDYGVGNIVVEHQLDNRVLARDFTWDAPPAGEP